MSSAAVRSARVSPGLVASALAALLGVALVPAAAAFDRDGPRDRTVARSGLIATSVRGRPITLIERGDRDSPVKELVIGCIHGNEPAGIAIAERLESLPLAGEAELLLVEDANPDGVASGTRTNGNGVDLNRNFPWHWRRSGVQGDPHYSGPRPFSEPESRALARLIREERPTVTIWFHQPWATVDESGGNVSVERRYAQLVGLPLRRLPRVAGGATDWQNTRFPATTSFVVELPAGSLSRLSAVRYARAALRLVAP